MTNNQAPAVLLTLGRLPKALELARSLHSVGCRVVIAEPFRWHVCKPSRAVAKSFRVTAPNTNREAYFAELLAIIESENIQLVLPVSEEALHVAALRSRLPDGVRLLCAPLRQLSQLHDKLSFAEYARALGLAVPPTYPEDSEAGRKLAASGDYVAKPAHSCSGIGVTVCRGGKRHQPGSPGMLVQGFADGDHLSSLTLLDKGRELVTVVYRGTVFAGTVAICFERVDDVTAVQDWVRTFAAQTDYSGFIAFDFIVDADGTAWAIECNPRPTSGVHFLDPQSLAQAILEPESVQKLVYKRETRMQWAYSTLTEAYAAIFRPREFWRRLRQMFAARDVVWSAADPLPFMLMTPMSWELLWPAMTSDLTLGEATQRDIAWLSDGPLPAEIGERGAGTSAELAGDGETSGAGESAGVVESAEAVEKQANQPAGEPGK